jgi:hypothetical protein
MKGPKVQFEPWEEDSDYSDQEGVVAPDQEFEEPQ